MKIGLYGGGFKPFTTGHFAKLADAIRDNDKVYLFYGMQQLAPTRYGKKGQPLKSGQKFRSIGDSGRSYDEKVAQDIFNIYKGALERIPEVEVVLVQSQAKDAQGNLAAIRAPVSAIFKMLEDFVDDPGEIEKITIYGDGDSMRPYMRSPMFKDYTQAGKIQFGGAIPSSPDDYTDKLEDLMAQGEEEARQALKAFYASKGEDLSDEEIEERQRVRGTMVRGLASSRETSEEAKRFLPPFLDNAEKDKIIQILTSEEDQSQDQQVNEEHLRSLIMGIIRG
jgi:glycosyltransferase involved in cell wall biosynthesis